MELRFVLDRPPGKFWLWYILLRRLCATIKIIKKVNFPYSKSDWQKLICTRLFFGKNDEKKLLTFTWFCPLRVKLASVAEIIVFFVIGRTFCISPYRSRRLLHPNQVARVKSKINCPCVSRILLVWALTYETGLLERCRVFGFILWSLGSKICRILLCWCKCFWSILCRLIRIQSQIWRWRLDFTVIIFVIWLCCHLSTKLLLFIIKLF